MSPQFRVTLTKEEVGELQKISSTGSRSAKIVLFARALLLLDDFSQVCERSSQWCELRYSQVQTAH